MNGKIVGIGIVTVALLAGAALYYLQVYHFYDEVSADAVEIRLTRMEDGQIELLSTTNVRAIDADSSPIRFRACFDTALTKEELMADYAPYPTAEPLTAPSWFDCFDAKAIGAALEQGRAHAFLGESEHASGVDRVVVVLDDGTGYAWNQLAAETEG